MAVDPRGAAPLRTSILLTAALVAGRAMAAPATADPAARPTFVEGSCDRLGLSPGVAARTRCGTVAVPRDYADPARGTYALAVVVIASATAPPRPDPDLYISGGPGSPLTVYAEAQAAHPLAPDRDQVLVDQRGTGASEPAICPASDRDLVAVVATDPARQTKRREVYAACRARAVAGGVDPADFGTTVTAEDFETVRRALGIARWTVFGVSYGTTVAMTMMALHPETIRAAVLDSVYPPDPILPPWPQTVAEARGAFFAACEADAGCRAAYPDLAGTYGDTLERLARRPLTMAFPPGMDRPDGRGELTPSLFAFVVARLVYYPVFYPGLPQLIAATHDGDTSLIAAALATLFTQESAPHTGSSLSLRAAVECRDRPRYRDGPTPSGADGVPDMTSLSGICGDWAPLGPPPLVPHDTAVPTLVLAGQFDPNAPVAESRRVADMIGPRASWVEFMGLGHSVRTYSACAGTMVAEFIAHPERPVAASCAARPPPIRFRPPIR